MTLTLHTLAPKKGARTKHFRIGRGEGSGRGKTAGRGTKGQKARTGGRHGLKLLGMRQMVLGMPKLRGFRSRYLKSATVRLDQVSEQFAPGERVDLKALKAKSVIPKSATTAKLVGSGSIDKPLVFINVSATASAKAAVEKAGGRFERTPMKGKKPARMAKKA